MPPTDSFPPPAPSASSASFPWAPAPGESPLAHPAFRAIFLAATFSYVGTFVQDVAESWLMLGLTHDDPVRVAMISTFYSIAAFALLLPAGLVADRVDRRKLLVVAQTWMAIVAGALAVVTALGKTTPAVLLAGAAALGVGVAFTSPTWNSLVPELVPRAQMPEAITLNAVSFNIARAVGPAIGGTIIAAVGATISFATNAVSFVAVIAVVAGYREIRAASERPRRTGPKSGAARGPVVREMFAAVAFARTSVPVRATLLASAMFACAAAGVSALLSVHAKTSLHGGPRGYGALVGAIGVGAIVAAFALRGVRSRLSPRAFAVLAMSTYGVAWLGVGAARAIPIAALLLVPAGAGWLSATTTFNALLQLSTPAWLKSRMMALYQLNFLFAWAVGASTAGAIAAHVGVRAAVAIFATGALGAAACTWRLPLPGYDVPDADRSGGISAAA